MKTDSATLMRPDPPEHLWPGRRIDEYDVHAASADPRDWFTVAERMQAHLEATFAYREAPGEVDPEWESAMILFWGDMGAGASALICHEAAQWFRKGHPFFHAGGFTFGRLIDRLGLTFSVESIPPNSVVAGLINVPQVIDALLAKGCRILMERHPDVMHRAMRERVTEVRVASWRKSRFEPENPVLAYHRLAGYPLRDTPPDRMRSALSEPFDNVQRITGVEARTALLLTDTFAPVRSNTVRFRDPVASDGRRQQG